MRKIKETLLAFHNDGTDPRKNDVWRILLFSFNYAGCCAITNLLGKFAYFVQNVLLFGPEFGAVLLIINRIVDAITDPIVAALFDGVRRRQGKFRVFMLSGCILTVLPALVIFFYPVHPEGIPRWASFAILGVCFLLITLGSTILQTATKAGQAIITQDPKQRPVYSLGQTISEAFVSLIILIVIESDVIGGMQDAFVWQIAVSVLSVVCVLFVFAASKAISNRDADVYYNVSNHAEKTVSPSSSG
jgi:Na+/melibiose symporter and related transporters